MFTSLSVDVAGKNIERVAGRSEAEGIHRRRPPFYPGEIGPGERERVELEEIVQIDCSRVRTPLQMHVSDSDPSVAEMRNSLYPLKPPNTYSRPIAAASPWNARADGGVPRTLSLSDKLVHSRPERSKT